MEKLNFTITKEDIRDYVKYSYKLPRMRKYMKKVWLKAFFTGAIVVMIFCIVINGFPPLTSVNLEFIFAYLTYLVGMLGIPIITMVILTVIMYFVSINDCFGQGTKATFRLFNNSSLNRTVEIEEDCLIITSEAISGKIQWSGVVDTYNTGKNILIFVSDYMAHFIPHRAFKDENEVGEFFDFVNNKVQSAKVQK